MELVINEWLLEYMRPDAKKANKEIALKILEEIDKGKIKIAVRTPSPFTAKCLKYRKAFQQDFFSGQILKVFVAEVLQNMDKCRLVNDDDFEPLPEDCTRILSRGNLSSDTYLFEAANTTAQKIILTTDRKLAKAFEKNPTFRVTLLSDFNDLFS